MYCLPSSESMRDHIAACYSNRPATKEAINNIYELSSIVPSILYLHGATGFPTKTTWLEAIHKGSYLTWSLVNVNNVNKYFPQSEEN